MHPHYPPKSKPDTKIIARIMGSVVLLLAFSMIWIVQNAYASENQGTLPAQRQFLNFTNHD